MEGEQRQQHLQGAQCAVGAQASGAAAGIRVHVQAGERRQVRDVVKAKVGKEDVLKLQALQARQLTWTGQGVTWGSMVVDARWLEQFRGPGEAQQALQRRQGRSGGSTAG